MNIVLYAPSVRTGGGTERVLVNLANYLHNNNYNVFIFTNQLGNNSIFDINTNIPIYEFWWGKIINQHQSNLIVKFINKFFGSFFLTRFLNIGINSKNDIIISFSAGITNKCFKTKFSKNIVSFEHYPNWAYNKYPAVQKEIRKNYPQLQKVITLTEHEKNVYQNLGCQVQKIPNAYSFYPNDPAKLLNKIVLSVGHFNDAKRRDLLIQSWKHVIQQHPDWKLIIVGDGELKANCLALIAQYGLENSIEIHDPVKNIEQYYLNASIFVLSSEFETLPLVLMEAKICGLPTVSFDIISGPNEIIQDQIDGFLVPFGDCFQMAEKVCRLIENSDMRVQFGQEARLNAFKQFNPETIYRLWDHFLHEKKVSK